eukprot:Opistho-2@15799
MEDKVAKKYLVDKHIPQLFESLMSGLMFHRPDDPIAYLETCLAKAKEQRGQPVQWDLFIGDARKTRAAGDAPADVKPSTSRPRTPDDKRPVLPPIATAQTKTPVEAAVGKYDDSLRDARVVFVLGGPGSGKGTQCERIVKEFGFTHLSTGDLLRAEVTSGSPLGANIKAIMEKGDLVPLDVTLSLLRNAMLKAKSTAKGFLIDGFPREIAQAHAFEEKIANCEIVLYFECSEATMEKRLIKRGETSGRADDNAETIRKRFRTFLEVSLPVIKHYEAEGK